jgi:thioredoxin reductase (NADPH)
MTIEPRQENEVRVLGYQWSPAAHDVKDYLARNRVPYAWSDVEEEPAAREEAERLGARDDDYPVVIFPDGTHLFAPDDERLAGKIGLSTEADRPFYDLIVVGGGPAGLAAAVYGASEGLRTVVFERVAPGGQAGMSAAIENYLGFPEGLSGADLAQRSVAQARRFGVEIVAARSATALREDGHYRVVELDDGSECWGHTVLLATGATWRTLDAPGCNSLIGRGIYYGAASAESLSFRGKDVYLLGGGNSAGQAAVHLARFARSVTQLSMEESLEASMSEYLLQRIRQTPNIHVRPCCTVAGVEGEGRLERLAIENVTTGERETVPANGLFVFIGAAPETEWLAGTVALDGEGYILSGAAVPREGEARWSRRRDPAPLETSRPGVFVAGDARAGSVKRIGAAVGEGSSAVQYIHGYLWER